MSFSKEDYVARIVNASPLQLIIINFEIIIDYINETKLYLQNDDKKFDFNIQKARQFLLELRSSLNMEFDISFELMNLYNFIDLQLAKYLFNKDFNLAKECIDILNNLLDAFKQIEKEQEQQEKMQTYKQSLIQNTQQIFAGFTYNKDGSLSEFIDTDLNRGFKA